MIGKWQSSVNIFAPHPLGWGEGGYEEDEKEEEEKEEEELSNDWKINIQR